MKRVVIVGATSAIAIAVARKLSEEHASLFLLARNEDKLSSLASDLKVRGASDVHTGDFEASDLNSHKTLPKKVRDALGEVDIVLIAFGTLPDQNICEEDPDKSAEFFSLNATSTISCLEHFAKAMAEQTHGTLAVITSVAGDRGRRSNYVYGSAKSAVSTYAEGLQMRFANTELQILDIRPGFVISPMTERFEKNALWAEPKQIADGIIKAIEQRKRVVYLPFFWRWIMAAIKSLPFFVMSRLKI